MLATLEIKTPERETLVNITPQLKKLVADSSVKCGRLIAFVPHTTAAITINESADPDVQRDLLVTLKKLIPLSGDYRHAEGNSDAHLKSSLFGASLTLLIEDGKIVLGTWQAVYFAEFDGPRSRRLHVRIVED